MASEFRINGLHIVHIDGQYFQVKNQPGGVQYELIDSDLLDSEDEDTVRRGLRNQAQLES